MDVRCLLLMTTSDAVCYCCIEYGSYIGFNNYVDAVYRIIAVVLGDQDIRSNNYYDDSLLK